MKHDRELLIALARLLQWMTRSNTRRNPYRIPEVQDGLETLQAEAVRRGMIPPESDWIRAADAVLEGRE